MRANPWCAPRACAIPKTPAAISTASAKAQKAQADTVLSMARTKESEAKAAETLAGIPLAQSKQALETAKAIASEMRPDPQQPQEPPFAGQ